MGFFQTNVVIGILLAYLSNFLIATMHLGQREWRWGLGVSAIPAIMFFVALFRIPRSPRWLAMQKELGEALQVLRLSGAENPKAELEEIVASVHLERAASADPLFSRQDAKPIFLALTMGMFCHLSGINAILYYLNDIFALAGITGVSGDIQAVAVGAMNLVGTLFAVSIIDKVGRRKLLLTGTAGLVVCLAGIAAIFMTHQHMAWRVWLLMA